MTILLLSPMIMTLMEYGIQQGTQIGKRNLSAVLQTLQTRKLPYPVEQVIRNIECLALIKNNVQFFREVQPQTGEPYIFPLLTNRLIKSSKSGSMPVILLASLKYQVLI